MLPCDDAQRLTDCREIADLRESRVDLAEVSSRHRNVILEALRRDQFLPRLHRLVAPAVFVGEIPARRDLDPLRSA
jgi:hypothetical protein